jgi:hypothetical protein
VVGCCEDGMNEELYSVPVDLLDSYKDLCRSFGRGVCAIAVTGVIM